METSLHNGAELAGIPRRGFKDVPNPKTGKMDTYMDGKVINARPMTTEERIKYMAPKALPANFDAAAWSEENKPAPHIEEPEPTEGDEMQEKETNPIRLTQEDLTVKVAALRKADPRVTSEQIAEQLGVKVTAVWAVGAAANRLNGAAPGKKDPAKLEKKPTRKYVRKAVRPSRPAPEPQEEISSEPKEEAIAPAQLPEPKTLANGNGHSNGEASIDIKVFAFTLKSDTETIKGIVSNLGPALEHIFSN
jgi:hypothetical protein